MNPDIKKFQQNLRQTTLGVTFIKKLYMNPSSMSGAQILSTMKALGFQIDDNVQLTADVAQVICSGGAVYEAIQVGGSAKDAYEYAKLGAASTRSITNIMQRSNWMDSDTASVVNIGVDVGMIIASMGADWKAWTQLAMDVAAIGPTKQAEADMKAIKDLKNKVTSRRTVQQGIFVNALTGIEKGERDIYGVFAEIAADAPDLWPQLVRGDNDLSKKLLDNFPELLLLPTAQGTVMGYGESKITGDWPWPASGSYIIESWNSKKFYYFETLKTDFTRESATEMMYELFIKPWVRVYDLVDFEIVQKGNASIEQIALLSLLISQDAEISDKTDYVKLLVDSALTPADLGSNILEDLAWQYQQETFKGIDTGFKEVAVSTSSSILKANQAFSANQKMKLEISNRLRETANDNDISRLVAAKPLYMKLQSWLDFQETTFEKDPSLGGLFGPKTQSWNKTEVRSWRQMHNFLSTLSLVSNFKNDPYIAKSKFAAKIAPYFDTIENFDRKFKDLYSTSVFRKVNRLALANIADMLGTTPDKLIQKKGPDGATTFTIKGV